MDLSLSSSASQRNAAKRPHSPSVMPSAKHPHVKYAVIFAAALLFSVPAASLANDGADRDGVVFKAGASVETFFIMFPELYTFNAKVVFNRAGRPLSPYFGIDAGGGTGEAGLFGLDYYVGANAGGEWSKTYSNGLILSPSLGVQAGIISYRDDYYDYDGDGDWVGNIINTTMIGLHFVLEVSFSNGRFYPYIYAGARLNCLFSTAIVPTYPLGIGMAF
ncbi:MAG: hypothetical protein FWB85_08310 [Chitinispirillia bacterium]|nr:hypothetical protein [Chitinispirillia bacterium]MCL2242261.1 hypothetical protein [Chitinispirillia bacterium]